MSSVVRRLAGVATLAVMSSNAMKVVRRVLVENDLAFCFAHVFGGDVAPDKKAAIAEFIADAGSGFGRRCSPDYDEEMKPTTIAAERTVLVTDTAGDVLEARKAGIRAVAVSWGMHSAQELEAAGAEFVALWPQEVGSYLMRGIEAEPRGSCALPTPNAAVDACCTTCAESDAGGSQAQAQWSAVADSGVARRERRAHALGSGSASVRQLGASQEVLRAVARIMPVVR
jgi:phosphoglycolate phosphatase